jgi:cystatin-C
MRLLMIKKLLLMLMSVAINAVMGCMIGLQAQQPPVAGGYQEASRTEPDVVSAAKFAIKEERRKKGVRVSLISIGRAETQVVAGINYRLCLRIKIKGKIQSVRTVVYKNLQRKYSLSSWEEDVCRSASNG